MKSKSIVLMLVAVSCGLVAMIGVQKAMNRGPVEENKPQTGQMLVATTEIGPGVMLTEQNTTFKEVSLDAIPEGAVRTLEEYEERAVLARTVAGQPIMLEILGARGVTGASSEIPAGMRLATIKVNQTTTHSGMMQAGDRVDVLLSFRSRTGDRANVNKIKTILEFIKVGAVDNIRDRTGGEGEVIAKNISLLVTPEQAKILMLAETKGELSLSLRSPTDDSSAPDGVLDDSIFEDGGASIGMKEDDSGYSLESDDQDELKMFLDGNEQASTDSVEPQESAAVPTWKVTIYTGTESQVTEFEYDENNQAVPVPEAAPALEQQEQIEEPENLNTALPAEPKEPVKSAEENKDWANYIKQYLQGA